MTIIQRTLRRLNFSNFIQRGLFVFVAFLFLVPSNTRGQETFQISVTGVPPVLSSPYVNDLEQNYQAGFYTMQINFNASGNAPVAFRFRIEGYYNDTRIINAESNPVSFEPGLHSFTDFFQQISFPFSFEELLNSRASEKFQQIIQSGSLPEGTYQIRITAEPIGFDQQITTIPANVMFQVRYPEPPVLLSPANDAMVSQEIPTFSWTPVSGAPGEQFEYELLLVELFDGQTPRQAIESNREHMSTTLAGQTVFSYTNEFMPLEAGNTYAWQLIARDANGQIPLSDDGESEIYTFTYRPGAFAGAGGSENLADISRIPLIPDFAYLTNFGQLETEETAGGLRLNGPVSLLLDFSGGDTEPVTQQVTATNLVVQGIESGSPSITSGSIRGRQVEFPADYAYGLDLINFQDIRWQLGEGLTASGTISLPNGQTVSTTNRINITRSGLSGRLVASGTPGNPLMSMGENPVELLVTQASLEYPNATLSGSGSLQLFDGMASVDVPVINLSSNSLFLDVSTDINSAISPVPESDLLQLSLNEATGQFFAGLENDSIDYRIRLKSGLALQLRNDNMSGATLSLVLDSQDGFGVQSFTPVGTEPNPTLETGFADLLYRDISLESLNYDPATGEWGIALALNGQLRFPAFGDAHTPEISNIVITEDGIQFPDINFTNLPSQGLQPFTIDNYGIILNSLTMTAFTFPWFEWDQSGAGPWEFTMDMTLETPGSGSAIPYSLQNQQYQLTDIQFANGSFEGSAEAQIVENARIELGTGFAVIIDEVGARITGTVRDSTADVSADLSLYGSLDLGQPFICPPDEQTSIGNTALYLNGDGTIQANIDGISLSSCPVEFGPFQATLQNADIIFGEENGEQAALIEAEAQLQVEDGPTVQGNITVDLMAGEVTEADFQIDEPFTWDIPTDNPVLSFRIDGAGITADGFYIDGRQDLMLPDTTIRATFDNLLVNYQTMLPDSGTVVFDQAFALEAGLDTTSMQLDYQAVSPGDTLSYNPGVLMELAGTVMIDSAGIRTNGSALAGIKLGDWSIDSLGVQYNQNFALSLSPFSVRAGQADFEYDGRQIALLDPAGFHPMAGLFEQVIPARIPLPQESIAYLQLKENGNLLVESIRNQNGSITLNTRPNQSVPLVVPGLQGNDPQPPQIDVTFNNLTFNPTSFRYVSGSMAVAVPPNSPGFDLTRLGIPLIVEQLALATRTIEGQQISGLFFDGQIQLYDQPVGNSQSASFYISDNGLFSGSVNLGQLNSQIPLVGQSNRVVLQVDSLSGTMNTTLPFTGTPGFDFDFDGGFRINDPDGNKAARADVDFEVSDLGFRVTSFDTTGMENATEIQLGGFGLDIQTINNLTLSYSEQSGFDFFAGLDIALLFNLQSGEQMAFPMQNVEIRDDIGFYIPEQEINSQSNPPLNAPAFNVGIFRIEPLAFRMTGDTLDWYNWSPEDVVDFLPNIDLALSLAGVSNQAPQLAQASLTAQNVGYDDGVLTGSIESYSFGQPPSLPIGGSVSVRVDSISGGLREENGEQEFDIYLSGYLGMPDLFQTESEYCEETEVTLAIQSDGGVVGNVNNFAECGVIERGPMRMTFPSSQLTFAYTNDTQSAVLSGQANAAIDRPSADSINATGNLTVDLIDQTVDQGTLSITGPFTWYYPESDSLFTFVVNNAHIDSAGLTFNGSGSLNLNGDTGTNVNYSNLTFNLVDGFITDGNVTIQNNFAMDIGIAPTTWSVNDTSTAPPYDPGVRLTMPPNLQINSNGLQVNGQSSASLEYNDSSLVALDLDFVNFLIGFQPVDVNSGRADMFVDAQGEQPTRVAWYDSVGFHAENVLGAAPLPDTLGLPNKDIAYVVLRDQDGDLNVQSSNVQGGMSISTVNPLPVVLASLENQQGAPQADVSFQDLVINDAYEVSAGSIAVDLGGQPIDISPYGDYPFYLTGLHYGNVEGNFDLWASARFQLPESLDSVEVNIDTLRFNENGFQQASFSAGNYTESHTEDENLDITSHAFSDSAFTLYVRGARASFGNTNQYSFSGDFTSDVLEDSAGTPTQVHYYADYTNGNWQFELETSHLPDQKIPMGMAELQFQNVNVLVNNNVFATEISGTLSMPDVMSNDFSMTVNGLHIGTDGVNVNSTSASGAVPQQFSLFSGVDTLTINQLSVTLTQERHLMLTMGGNLLFFDRDISFSDLQIGTDGTLAMGSAQANLLENPEPILGEYLTLDSLIIGIENNVGLLTAAGTTSLPDPMGDSSSISITVNTDGDVQTSGPSFDLANNPPTASLGDDFASLSLTGFSLEFDPKNPDKTEIMADANLTIDNKTIQFGDPGSPNKWGIRYQYGEQLEWNITNSPTFEFEADFFSVGITNVEIADARSEDFGVNIDGNVGLIIDSSIESTISMEDFQITSSGPEMGEITGGSMNIMDVISISVGEIQVGEGELTITQQSGTNSDPGASDTTIVTEGHVLFGGASIDIAEGTFTGGVNRVLYYKTSNSLYLNVDSASVGFHDILTLNASMEYLKKPNGFRLMVAGGGTVGGFPGGAISLAAMGKISTLNEELSLGVFVKAELTQGVPLFPGVAYLGGFGGGFFLNPETSDFQNVAQLLGYDPSANEERTPPWTKSQNQDLNFAVMIYGAVDFVGMGGGYAFSAEAYMVVTGNFISLDAEGYVLSQEGSLEGNMYLSIDWSQGVAIQGGGGVDLLYSPLIDGNIQVDFQVIAPENGNTVWAVTGGTGSEGVNILNFITTQADFVASPDGFYFSMGVSQGFDVLFISIHSNWNLELWWVYQEQFGAYTEIGFDASLFKGAAKIGGDLKGALIIEGAGDYLVYAAASAYVKVIGVIDGTVHVWVALRNGDLNGGRGPSKYSRYIEQARAQAQNMDEKMSDVTDQLNALQNAPQGLAMSDETKAAAGQRILMGDQSGRDYFANQMLAAEQIMVPDPNPVFTRIADQHIRSSRPFRGTDTDLESLRQSMNQEITDVADIAQTVRDRLAQTRSAAIEWQEEAAQYNESILNSPVTSQLQWNGDQPASFSVDSSQNATNSGQLTNLKENIEALDQLYQASIDSVSSNISKIDEAMSGSYTLPESYTEYLQSAQYANQTADINLSEQNTNTVSSFDGIQGVTGGSGTQSTSSQSTDLTQVDYEPSANYMSESYSEATAAIDEYFGKYISKLWMINNWASVGKLSSIRGEETYIANALKDMLGGQSTGNGVQYTLQGSGQNASIEFTVDMTGMQPVTYYQGGTQTPQWSDLSSSQRSNINFVWESTIDNTRDATAERIEVIYKADTSYSWSTARDSSSAMRSRITNWYNNQDYGSIVRNYHESGMSLWYESLELGYQNIMNTSQQRAQDLVQTYNSQMDSMKSAHEEFTRLVDDLYDIKANMTVNLYGMIEAYAEWRSSVLGDSAAQEIRQQKDDLQAQLTTPTINNITLSHELNDFVNRMDINWSASHPTGDLVETSVNLTGGTGTSVISQNMFSVGNESEITRYAFRENTNDESHNYRVVIRARGPAGTTISRAAAFSVPVDEHTGPGGSIPSGQSPSAGGIDIMEEDTSPPSKPLVSPDYTQHGAYWTSDSSQIVFDVLSVDTQSDIAEFHYAIGTSQGDTNLVGWTVGQGERVLDQSQMFSNVSGVENIAQKITTHLVTLETGTPYYLSVRSVNGAGDTSSVTQVDDPVRYDNSAPSDPVVKTNGLSTSSVDYGGGILTSPVQEAPDFEAPNDLPVESTPEYSPRITVDWDPATDAESDIDNYEYVVSTEPAPENAFSTAQSKFSDDTEETIIGDPLNYTDEFYVHIRAHNNAGISSPSAITYGPITPRDRTPPELPKIYTHLQGTDLGFYLARPSYDRETEIEGYEYSLGTHYSDHSVLPWTELDLSDGNTLAIFLWRVSASQVESRTEWPDMDATKVDVPDPSVNTNEDLYLHVRAQNGQEIYSSDATSGSFVFDDTPPPDPTVELTDLNNDNVLINITNVGDPESEISSVEYKVVEANSVVSSTLIEDWSEPLDYEIGGSAGYMNTVDYSGHDYDSLQVQVRITNENGLQTTVKEGYVPQYQAPANQTYPVGSFGGF